VGEGILRTPTQVAQLSQTSHFVIAQKQNECDGGVYPFAHQEAVKEHFSLLRVVLQAIQSEVIAGTNECGFHGVDDFAIKQASDEWCDHGNVSQAPSEAPRGWRRQTLVRWLYGSQRLAFVWPQRPNPDHRA